jgi:hypothetical protein
LSEQSGAALVRVFNSDIAARIFVSSFKSACHLLSIYAGISVIGIIRSFYTGRYNGESLESPEQIPEIWYSLMTVYPLSFVQMFASTLTMTAQNITATCFAIVFWVVTSRFYCVYVLGPLLSRRSVNEEDGIEAVEAQAHTNDDDSVGSVQSKEGRDDKNENPIPTAEVV